MRDALGKLVYKSSAQARGEILIRRATH
jgi:hypothetical protein